MSRRDPLVISGTIVLLLFLFFVSALSRLVFFLRFFSVLLFLAVLSFAAIAAVGFYFKEH